MIVRERNGRAHTQHTVLQDTNIIQHVPVLVSLSPCPGLALPWSTPLSTCSHDAAMPEGVLLSTCADAAASSWLVSSSAMV